MSKIVCVVPSIRPERMEEFRKAWAHLFEKHNVTLITVWDGDAPEIEIARPGSVAALQQMVPQFTIQYGTDRSLFCHKTDAVRNYGFVVAASSKFDYILTLDDDVHPPAGSDPIQEHLDALQRHVPISWMNTALDAGWRAQSSTGIYERIENPMYLRGFPYGIRDEAPVMVSHGVWVNVPDFDGRTQLELGRCIACEGNSGYEVKRDETGLATNAQKCGKCNGTGYDGSRLPYSLPYFRGSVPKGVYMPFCGMNVMVRKEALPYLYFAPMGPDTGVEGLNRFADIWCGILLKRACDSLGWAIYTGASTVIHTRASDPFKNVEQERLGIEWNEWMWQEVSGSRIANATDEFRTYLQSYRNKAARFRDLIRKLQGAS